jgi:hypothetical protein
MAKKTPKTQFEARTIPQETTKVIEKNDEDTLTEVMQHYKWWTDDNERRTSRTGGWKDVMDGYWGKLPDDWPFTSHTVDPRIRTSLLEKNARLTNRTMKGKVTPKKGTTVVKARLNGAVIDNQWDNANDGGSMQQKLSSCDLDSRLNGTKFAYIYWKELKDTKGELKFDGNEMKPLDINDCGIDPNCEHVRNAKWFQHRTWMPVENITANKDLYPGTYEKLMKLIASDKSKIAQKRRDVSYTKRIKQLEGLEDRLGTDPSFPVIEWLVEYRIDKWVIFCPEYSLLMAVMDNPYEHRNIPISQLKYYPIDGDNLGSSEVEPVLPLWRAIQAFLCAFMDESLLKIRPPLKVVEGAARIETIVYEPEAMWLVDNVNAVMEVESRADSIKYFQATYPMLVSAFNVAMGDMSQGISNADPMQSDKTATEIRQISKQQNTRDQKNQQELAEFVKDFVGMWIANNKQFLFRDPEKKEHLLQILGDDNYNYFKREGMDEMILPNEVAMALEAHAQDMEAVGQPISPDEIKVMAEQLSIPKYPVVENPEESDPSKLSIKSKLRPNQLGDGAELSITPDDLDGNYDYVPDIKSMEAGAGEQLMFARTQAIAQVTNPNVLQLLAMQGVKPLIKDLLIADFEDKGLNDASKYFESIQPALPTPGVPPTGAPPTGGTLQTQQNAGMGNVPQAPTQPSIDQQMAGPQLG